MRRAMPAMRRAAATLGLAACLMAALIPSTAGALDYVAYTLAAEQNLPRLCLNFSTSLGRAQPGELAPFVRVEPAADLQ